MNKRNEKLHVLVITMERGMRQKIRDMIEGRPIKLEFIDRYSVDDLPSKKFSKNDLFCLSGSIGGTGPILTFYQIPRLQKQKKERAKKR